MIRVLMLTASGNMSIPGADGILHCVFALFVVLLAVSLSRGIRNCRQDNQVKSSGKFVNFN